MYMYSECRFFKRWHRTISMQTATSASRFRCRQQPAQVDRRQYLHDRKTSLNLRRVFLNQHFPLNSEALSCWRAVVKTSIVRKGETSASKRPESASMILCGISSDYFLKTSFQVAIHFWAPCSGCDVIICNFYSFVGPHSLRGTSSQRPFDLHPSVVHS